MIYITIYKIQIVPYLKKPENPFQPMACTLQISLILIGLKANLSQSKSIRVNPSLFKPIRILKKKRPLVVRRKFNVCIHLVPSQRSNSLDLANNICEVKQKLYPYR